MTGLYRGWVFPRLCHLGLRGRHLGRLRRAALAAAAGRVLEVGVGTGLNLGCYPPAVERVVGIDPNAGMLALAAGRAAAHPVELRPGRAEALPFPEAAFDTVVTTWTLCSVEDPAAALVEIHRVLAPGGHFLFIEHGLSDRPRVARWQRRLTPLQRRVADNCHLDRHLPSLLAASPLASFRVEGAHDPELPRVAGFLYRGEAVRG